MSKVVVWFLAAVGTYKAVEEYKERKAEKKRLEREMEAQMFSSSQDFSQRGAQGIMVNATGSSQSIPLIYGSTRTGGVRVYVHTEGTTGSGDDEIKNTYLHLAFAIAEGEVNKCSAIYFNDVVAGTCSSAGSTDPGSWTINSPWNGHVEMYFRPGTDSQTEITELAEADGTAWDPHFKGIAYAYIRLKYEEEKWVNGVPTITFDIEGKKVPATGDGTSLSYTNGDNPANCILDYLVNTRYGKGIDPADIDLASFETARAYCDGRFHTRGNINTSASLYGNLFDLMTSCRGYIAFGNKYKLIIDKASSEIPFEITEDNIIGNVSYSLGGKSGMYNKITAKYLNESKKYKDDVKVVESSTLKTQDNGLSLETEISLPFTKTETVANQLLVEEINQSRQSHIISLKCTVDAVDLEVGDLVNVTNETFGITQKTFRVLETIIETNSEVSLSLVEYDSDVYGDSIIEDARADDND
jgi:hypothetical protein